MKFQVQESGCQEFRGVWEPGIQEFRNSRIPEFLNSWFPESHPRISGSRLFLIQAWQPGIHEISGTGFRDPGVQEFRNLRSLEFLDQWIPGFQVVAYSTFKHDNQASMKFQVRESGIQEFRNSRIQVFANSWVPEFLNHKISGSRLFLWQPGTPESQDFRQ